MNSSDNGDAYNDGSSGGDAWLVEDFPLSYVRPVTTDKGLAYGVFSGDGTQLALFGTKDAAFYAAKQHDLEPALIH